MASKAAHSACCEKGYPVVVAVMDQVRLSIQLTGRDTPDTKMHKTWTVQSDKYDFIINDTLRDDCIFG
jgi:hypothetical protein